MELVALQQQSSAALQQQTEGLCVSCDPSDAQLLRGRLDTSLQPHQEALQLALLRLDCLEKLEAFLQTQGAATGVLGGLRHTVEGAGSWDRGRVEELQRELAAVILDIRNLETRAVWLTSGLGKAPLHLRAEAGARASR